MFLLSYFKKTEKSKEHRGKSFSFLPVFLIALTAALFAIWAVYRVNTVPSKAYCEGLGEYSLLASTDIEREGFFAQFGFTAESVCHSLVRIPSQGEVFEEYNALQKAQGLDLKPYMGKQAHQYIFSLKKEGQESPLYAVLFVYRDRVAAVHITDYTPNGMYLSILEG